MVQASVIFGRVRALLDDDNSDRYTTAEDLVPAINSAISYLVSVFNAAFEQKKIQPEILAELTAVLVLLPQVTGNTARVNLNLHAYITPYSEKVWTIVGVDPNPTFAVIPLTDPPEEIDTLGESISRFAKRLTLEEWNHALEDPFAPGTGQTVPSDFQRVCYTGPGRYFYHGGLAGEDNLNPYLFLRPGSLFSPAGSRIAVWVLRNHPEITGTTSEILFPPAVHNFIVQKMIQYISYQHGDDRYFKITDKEIKELIQLMNG